MTTTAEKRPLDEHQRRDAAFIGRPDDWPWWPMLPLKRLGGAFHEPGYHGILLAERYPPYTVSYTVWSGPSMFALDEHAVAVRARKGGKPATWCEVLAEAGAREERYESVEDLVREWEVD